jgi:hypothetical protein
MPYKQTIKTIQKKTKDIINIIYQRNHLYINKQYKNRNSILIIYCPIHDNEYKTTFYNYKRSRFGCYCCSKAEASDKLKNRKFSQKTRLKMSKSALSRPSRGGKYRRWRETFKYRKWRESVLKKYDNKCAITNISSKKDNLEVHHLYSAKKYPDLIYNINNGIVLHQSIHILFHKKYGYTSNNLEQFCEFLLFLYRDEKHMPISSQGELENSQGSETRVYDPERVMKLHERLERLLIK